MSKSASKKITVIAAALAAVGITGFILSQNANSNPTASNGTAAKQGKVVVAYQTGVDPTKVAQVNGVY